MYWQFLKIQFPAKVKKKNPEQSLILLKVNKSHWYYVVLFDILKAVKYQTVGVKFHDCCESC